MTTKKEVMELRASAFDARLALSRAAAAIEVTRDAHQAAKADYDRLGVEYERTLNKALELESATVESIARGEPVKGFELLPVVRDDTASK